jgi:hypothetical protein
MAGEAASRDDELRARFRAAWSELERGHAEGARANVEHLLRAAPGNASVEQLARIASIVGFAWAAERAPAPSVPRATPAAECVDLVAFHVDQPRAPSGVHGDIDYHAVTALALEAARQRAPRARAILLTDERTMLADGAGFDEVRRAPLDASLTMFERMRLQLAYLASREPGRVSVLMDTDVVVNAEPAHAFAWHFDVGLTWRAGMPDAPFNGGLILVAEGEAGARFFAAALACYAALAADAGVRRRATGDLRAWWGDQLALASLVGHRTFAERAGDSVEVDGTRVRFLPCDEYNFTPEPGQAPEDPSLAAKRFLQFKGNRKALMAAYVERMRTTGA